MPSLVPPPQRPPKPSKGRGRGLVAFVGGSGLAVSHVLAVVIGLQLGAIPWRFRKQMWQLQGALAGGLVVYLVGWSVAKGGRREDDGEPRA